MKKALGIILLLLVLMSNGVWAQTVTSRTNEFEVDLSDPKKVVNSTVPVINWITPVAEASFAQDSRFKI